MVTRLGTPVLLIALSLGLLSGCGDDSGSGAEGSEPTATSSAQSSEPTDPTEDPSTQKSEPSEPVADGTRVVVGESEFGPMLFDDSGQAIYLFDVETNSKPRCYDDCAEAWPPVLTDGAPVGGRDADDALLGTVKRTDGTTQVTYNDHPLYFYAHEGKNEVECHDVFLNGGNWYVVQPGGDAAPPG